MLVLPAVFCSLVELLQFLAHTNNIPHKHDEEEQTGRECVKLLVD